MAHRVQTNQTTLQDGARPVLNKLDSDTFQCPFCERTGSYPGLISHLQSHQRSIVKYGGPSNHNDRSSDDRSSDDRSSDDRSSDDRSSDGSDCCSNKAQYFQSPQNFDVKAQKNNMLFL
ncbi:hypothetical protein NQZ68_033552 [Dissostichus eleginoides]|nr:hypothetical protein NQZ68_033552 [Dissostichus eleginoides]